jgi:predicted metal-dependent enzyme (double-stranded beta helix superfamily)
MFDVDLFVDHCRAALNESSPQSAVKEIVERAMSSPREVLRALGTPRTAEFATLYRSPDLTVLKFIWAPCMTLYPHNHQMWAVIGLYGGREDNVFYRRTAHGLVQSGGKQLNKSDTTILGETVIHSVTNPLREYTAAIHVYGGDFFAAPRSEWDPETLEERPFSVERAKQAFANANERWLAEAVEP